MMKKALLLPLFLFIALPIPQVFAADFSVPQTIVCFDTNPTLSPSSDLYFTLIVDDPSGNLLYSTSYPTFTTQTDYVGYDASGNYTLSGSTAGGFTAGSDCQVNLSVLIAAGSTTPFAAAGGSGGGTGTTSNYCGQVFGTTTGCAYQIVDYPNLDFFMGIIVIMAVFGFIIRYFALKLHS